MTLLNQNAGDRPSQWRFGRPHLPRASTLVMIVCVAVAIWLVAVPITALFHNAFSEDTALGPGAWTLQNFVDAYSDSRIAGLLVNSVLFAVGTAAVTLVLGGAVCWAVERTDAPCASIFHGLALLSFAIPGLLTTMAWIFVFSPNIGWANAALQRLLSLSAAPINIYSMGGMIWVLASHYFPLVYLSLGPAARALDVRLEEAAAVSGGRTWQVLVRITLPMLRPAMLSALLLLFVLGMSSYEVPRLIGRPARIEVFTTEIQNAVAQSPPEFGVASALSILLLAICVVVVVLYRRATRHAEAFTTVTGKGYTPSRIRLGHWRWPVAAAIGVLFAFTLGLPLLTLVWQSFHRNLAQPFQVSDASATLENFRFVLGYPIFLESAKTSIALAAMAATTVAGLTLVMAWIALRSLPRFGWLLDAIVSTPIAIPGVIVGAGILSAYLLLPLPVYNTVWILLIAYVTLYLPYGMRFASGGISQIHKELEEAAEVAGARLGQVFRRVLLPLLLPMILAGWMYVFVLSVRELGASIFLIGPGTSVLGTITLTMWEEGGSYGAVAALGVIQIVPMIAIVGLLRWLERLVQRRSGAVSAARTE